MAITKEEVLHIADLARLELTHKEVALYQEQLSSILHFIETLNEVDTHDVVETNQVTGLVNRYRDDEVRELSVEDRVDLLSCADSVSEDGGIKVRKVFDS
ncbi:MAG TPA: Asp-tRNA(Asn)/Glu-tRNA(Gln) amidotransferase subunit GatC [Patescibacteria group bacterium]|nr:Asp-tRNA(Asn)/Glu-tRNA(Gln) amidotransferase subunit GatC [Patescibacteria group bacterium]